MILLAHNGSMKKCADVGINSLRPFSGEFSMILLAHNGS